jgi:AhpD family alkylhydroperoxidase
MHSVSHFAGQLYLRGAATNNKECTTMDARLNLFDNATAGKELKCITSAAKVITDSRLPAATQQLVALRASQIDGCGFCTDMHTKDAALLVAVMNTVNRLNVIVQQPAGDYQPGQFG